MTLQLNENSPKVQMFNNVSIKLKEHQLTSIYAMDQLEKTGKVERIIPSIIHNFHVYVEPLYGAHRNQELKNIKYTIDTNYGILADIVGSGKT